MHYDSLRAVAELSIGVDKGVVVDLALLLNLLVEQFSRRCLNLRIGQLASQCIRSSTLCYHTHSLFLNRQKALEALLMQLSDLSIEATHVDLYLSRTHGVEGILRDACRYVHRG